MMIDTGALKIAASTLALVAAVGCSTTGGGVRTNVAVNEAKADQQAAALQTKIGEALRVSDVATALTHAERSVELSPRDVAYRAVLADLYLKNGRFASAEAAYGDVLTLNPTNMRAALQRALVQIALGKKGEAIAALDGLANSAAPADLGLAYALAGQPERAVTLLEPAAREPDAGARVRQNLALSYALAGNWQKARTIASQDLGGPELGQRLQQWAALAKPAQSWEPVSALLGVSPAADPGRPAQLALAAPAEVAPQVAEVAAPVAPVTEAAPVAPVQIASDAEPVAQLAAAVNSLVDLQPAVTPAAAVSMPAPAFAPAKAAPRILGRAEKQEIKGAKPGRFVVQLGAFKSAQQVEAAWANAHRRYAIANYMPLSTTVSIPGKGVFHRLSVSGFGSQADAARVCGTIRSKGGTCFVRTPAGDAPVRWAARYTPRRG